MTGYPSCPGAAESSAGLQAAQQQRAAAALAQRLQAACVTIASHEMAAAEFKRYFKQLQDRNAQLGASLDTLTTPSAQHCTCWLSTMVI